VGRVDGHLDPPVEAVEGEGLEFDQIRCPRPVVPQSVDVAVTVDEDDGLPEGQRSLDECGLEARRRAGVRSVPETEQAAAEGEDAAVGADQPVALAVGCGRAAGDPGD
jgi:hypothetical protein